MSNGPITDVNTLPVVSAAVAAAIKQAAKIGAQPQAPGALAPGGAPEIPTKAGEERWPVKTGQDFPGVAAVGKDVIGGKDLGAGIVPATVEELITAPRPDNMPDPAKNYDAQFHAVRVDPAKTPVEVTIWQVEATITAMKLEADGDYHLVLQGASGETMIGEIPTPTAAFVGKSPWLANIKAARAAVDDKFVKKLSPAAFVPMGDKLVPRASMTVPAALSANVPHSFAPAAPDQPPPVQPFKTQLPPTRARITGVGFFDAVHGQMGVSQFNGIELHPVLKIEWL